MNKREINPLMRGDGSSISLSENIEQSPQNEDRYLPIHDFNMKVQSRLQELALNDKSEQREIARHYRVMERDAYRSKLKCQELYRKQRMREIHEEIILRGNTYFYIRLNGNGDGLYQHKVFSARIQDVQCFQYQGSREVRWQVTLVEECGGKKVVSPLYTQDDLKILARLKRTILAIYDDSDSTKSRSYLWEWLCKELISRLDQAEIVEIPSRSGWYKNAEGYHFYTMADEDTSRFLPNMQKFDLLRCEGLNKNNTLCALMDDLEQAGDQGFIGMLLEYRFGTLFGGLIEKPCYRTGIVVYGEEAETIADFYLRTMINDVDTVNLDSDRIGKIREKVGALKDTPMIYMVSDPGNRSVKNRLREILSWMRTSCVEGERVRAPFVFCLKYFSSTIPLEDMLIVNTSCINLPLEEQILDKFQYLVIEEIEKSGSYWVNKITNRYKQYRENGMCEAGSMTRMITDVLLKMFDVIENDNDLHHRFRKLLEAGEAEIKEQLTKRKGRLAEIFKEQVINLVDSGSLTICDREKAPISAEYDYIYFDSESYYFTETALKKIGELTGIDKKSILYIKRELFELSMVKTYRATGYRQEEMNIDFRICNAYGQRKDLSGMAVLREFWDDIGGIALCERG